MPALCCMFMNSRVKAILVRVHALHVHIYVNTVSYIKMTAAVDACSRCITRKFCTGSTELLGLRHVNNAKYVVFVFMHQKIQLQTVPIDAPRQVTRFRYRLSDLCRPPTECSQETDRRPLYLYTTDLTANYFQRLLSFGLTTESGLMKSTTSAANSATRTARC